MMRYNILDIFLKSKPQKMCYDGIQGITWPEMPIVKELPSLFIKKCFLGGKIEKSTNIRS